MAETEVGSLKAKVGLDTATFQEGMSLLSTKMKLISQDFENASGGLDAVADASKITALKVSELTSKIELQRKFVEQQKETYDKMSQTYAEGSKKLLDYELKVKKSEGALQDLENQLKQSTAEVIDEGQALNKTGDEAALADKKTDGLEKATARLHTAMNGVGKGLKIAAIGVAAVATAAIAATAAVGKMIMTSLENADATAQTAEIYGMSAERVQELTYVGTKLDVELDTMTKGQTLLTKNMLLAGKATSEQGKIFKELKVNAYDPVTGAMRDSKTVMTETITALGSMKNETERDAYAMKLFGKSAMELNPLIKAGGAEIARLTEEARTSGAVMSNEAVKGLDDFGDSLEALKLSVKGIAGSFATSLLPAMNGFIDFTKTLIPSLQNAIKTGDFFEFGLDLGYGIEKGIKSISIGIEKMLPVVTQIITSLVNAIVVAIPVILPALIKAVLALINAFVGILQTNGPLLIKAGLDAIMTLIDGIVSSLPAIVDMAIVLIMALVNGLIAALPKLIDAQIKLMLALVDGILVLLPQLIPAAIQAIVVLAQGLIDALPKLIEKLPMIITTIINVIVANLPLLINAAVQIIVALTTALVQNYPLMIKAGIQILGAVFSGIISTIGQVWTIVPKLFESLKQAFFSIKWGELGTNLMNGIIDGVVNAAKNLANAVVKAAKAALDAVKSFLGIRSPSTVMRDEVGAQVGAGMAEGITKSQGLLTKAMSGVQKVTVQSATNSNFGGQVAKAAAPSGNVTVQNMYVRNDSDIKRIAKELFVLQNNLQRGGGLA